MKVVEVFADVCCPFTHVGLRRFVEHRARIGAANDVVLRVHAWPLELINGEPLSATVVAHEVRDLRAQVAGDVFTGFRAEAFPATSMPAFALAAAAYERDLALGERVSLAVRDALFERGVDVSSPDALAELARELGVPAAAGGHDAVEADWAQGRSRGVVGSPHFFASGEGFFCPGLSIDQRDGHFHIATDHEAFEAFLARVYG